MEQALSLIGALYRQEKRIRKKKLAGPAKLAHRREHGTLAVQAFFDWCEQQRQRTDLLPSNPFGQALAYAAQREAGLRAFLEDPEIAIDTNHLERGLRPIPMGRRNWLFAWTELGARRIGAIQSLLTTCQLQGVNPYLPGRCVAASGPASGQARHRVDPADVEDAVRRRSATFRPGPRPRPAASISRESPERPGLPAYSIRKSTSYRH